MKSCDKSGTWKKVESFLYQTEPEVDIDTTSELTSDSSLTVPSPDTRLYETSDFDKSKSLNSETNSKTDFILVMLDNFVEASLEKWI